LEKSEYRSSHGVSKTKCEEGLNKDKDGKIPFDVALVDFVEKASTETDADAVIPMYDGSLCIKE
jgi:hypothetical protein